MIYYIVFWALTLLTFVEVFVRQGNPKAKRIAFLVLSFLFILFAGLRNNGIDFGSYSKQYTAIQDGTLPLFNTSLELGYSLLNYLAPSFRWVVLAMAFFSVFARVKAYEKNHVFFVLLPMLLFFGTDFIYYDMGIMRQGLSMSICLMALPYAAQKSKKFFLFILLATMFHISAVLFCAMYFISNKEYSRKFYYIGILAASVFFIGGISYTNLAVEFVNRYGGAYITHKFNKFMTYDQTSLTLSYIRRILFSILFIEMFKRGPIRYGSKLLPKRETSPLTWLYINGFFLSVVAFGVISPLFSSVAGRFTAGFYTLYSFVYFEIFKDRRQITNLLLFVVFIVLLFDTFTGIVGNESHNYIPYVFGW